MKVFIGLYVTLILCIGLINGKQNSTWVAPKSADNIVNPLKGINAETIEGKKIYTQMCVVCHGEKGRGNGMAAASLNPKPSNFTGDKVQLQTDGAIFWKIAEGRGAMASYKTSITEHQRWQLVNYIRTFKK